MADDIAISVQNVSKDFVLPHERTQSIKSAVTGLFRSKGTKTNQHALRDISFDIKKGEFFGIVGRNGSGKSTLLKILAEIYRPTKGSVQIDGRLVPFIELGVGFNPELTGRENVYLSGALSGFSKDEINAMYDDIVSFAELEEFMDQKLKNYSSGMQVRLAFSVATRSKAEILLIDEVLAVGDADFQRKCFNYFKRLKKSKTTVVFVSHDMDAVREYCDRAVLIDDSKILAIGATEDIAQNYTKLFSVSPDHESIDSPERWGIGGITTSSCKIEVTDECLVIIQSVSSDVDITNPSVGFRIRSISGENVTGTNTKIEKLRTGLVKKNSSTTVRWVVPNVFASGDYVVDFAIMGDDAVTVYDWWDEAATVAIKKDRNLPYLIDPATTGKIV